MGKLLAEAWELWNSEELRRDNLAIVNWMTGISRCGLGPSCKTGRAAEEVMAVVAKGMDSSGGPD